MKKLSEYKKAEKGAMALVADYESMKLKYFNVLQENEKNKQQIQQFLQKGIDSDTLINRLNSEKQKHIDEMYKIRMEIGQQVDIVKEKEEKITQMTTEHNELIQKAANLVIKDKEITVLQNDLERFLDIMSQVDKHLKTLIKYLRNVVDTSRDPLIIEHTQKQIKNIERIHKDIKKTINNKDCTSEASKIMDCIFSDIARLHNDTQDLGKVNQ